MRIPTSSAGSRSTRSDTKKQRTNKPGSDQKRTNISMGDVIELQSWNTAVDGELNVSNMKKKLVNLGYNTTIYNFTPGTDFPDHTHNVTKMDAITSGQMQFCMYGQTVVLKSGDMVQVPKNTVHNAKVVGNEDVTFFDSTR